MRKRERKREREREGEREGGREGEREREREKEREKCQIMLDRARKRWSYRSLKGKNLKTYFKSIGRVHEHRR